MLLASAKRKLLAARRLRTPIPAIDTTVYVAWNAMFVSAYLEAARVLGRDDCRAFALKTLDRILAEAWEESKGFLHRVGGPRLDGSLDDQIFMVVALLDAYEATLDRRYFEIAERTMRLAVERYGDPEAGGFFDRAKDAAPMGGMEIRRKPLQDSPTPGANSVAVIALDRLYGLTGEKLYRDWAEKTLEAFVGLVPQYGLFAATYGLAALLHARHSLQVVVLGAAGDPKAAALEKSRKRRISFRQNRVARNAGSFGRQLRWRRRCAKRCRIWTRRNLRRWSVSKRDCFPPVADPDKLKGMLTEIAAEAAGQL